MPPTAHTSITKLLIANRGEIAARIARTARAMGIATVAVYSDADQDAPFTRVVDESVHLPGSAPGETYLRGDLIVDAALRVGADAVHPGYGFLSENAAFARSCGDAGITFVGPPPSAIEAMGSKIEAKRLMAEAGVPVLPGFTVEGAIGRDLLPSEAERVGYPIMVKAAFGGGGRGMRVVHHPDELLDGVAQAEREAASAFGDGTVFLERFVESPRHIEVQVFGDTQGNVVHLFERECSIQRRHQKIIEESPSPAVDDALREHLGATAVSAAKAIGYVGAGTVEFVMDPAGNYFFLEVNTRLQVEHPVTEMITGLDLVRVQLDVASGKPLPPDVTDATVTGHAVEARLYAEDVPAGFLPASGVLRRFDIPVGDGVRVDAGYADGSTVSTFYDAMLAKVIAWAPSRDEAIDRLSHALRETAVHGVVTNRALLVRILATDDFRSGRTDTGFLERHDPIELGRPLLEPGAAVLHAHAVGAFQIAGTARHSPVPAGIPMGWRNVGGGSAPLEFVVEGETVSVPSRIQEFEGITIPLIDDAQVVVEQDGVRRTCAVLGAGDDRTWYVDSPLGSTAVDAVDRFPEPGAALIHGSLVAPMPGTVTSVRVAVGDRVTGGQAVVTVEAMKMEHSLRTPYPGTVAEVRVQPGAQVANGEVLVIVDEDVDEDEDLQ
jgi:acyl-CoA carboxylase subunit alpha